MNNTAVSVCQSVTYTKIIMATFCTDHVCGSAYSWTDYRVGQHASTEPDGVSLHAVTNHLNIDRLRLQIHSSHTWTLINWWQSNDRLLYNQGAWNKRTQCDNQLFICRQWFDLTVTFSQGSWQPVIPHVIIFYVCITYNITFLTPKQHHTGHHRPFSLTNWDQHTEWIKLFSAFK